jgi:hypothetical protein|tara:strand:+ start:542 stop:943 length:402 start_codon:yes stop_codon:yes gene_type:complete
MSLYKEIENIVDYCSSIRKLKTYLSFDMVFPATWAVLKSQVDETKTVFNKSDDKGKNISFVSEINEQSISETISNIETVINYNKEKEEKERLFKEKVNELKNLFEKGGLEDLKNLKFDVDDIPKLESEQESIS